MYRLIKLANDGAIWQNIAFSSKEMGKAIPLKHLPFNPEHLGTLAFEG